MSSIILSLSDGGPLEFKPGLSPNYAGPILRGAIAVHAKTNDAQLTIQEFSGDEYCIRFTVGKFFKRLKASGNILERGLYSCLMLKDAVRKEIDSIGKLHIRQDQYSCFYTEPTPCSARFEKYREFRILDIFYSPKFLEDLLPFYPELKEVLTTSPGAALPGRVGWALPSMKEITIQLLNSQFDEATSRLYFDIKVREYILEMLQGTYRRKPADNFTPWETARIYEAKDLLETYIHKKPPTIQAISLKVALNKHKLTKGFRQFFNSSIFDWLMERKMQHARDLVLNSGMRIREIGKLVGYPRSSNFITAFRRRFNMTPGSLRRK